MPARRNTKSTPLDVLLAADERARDEAVGRNALVFEVGGALYAVDAASVEIVVGKCFVAPVPAAPAELMGIASVHGRMRLAVDLARLGGRPATSSWWLVTLQGDTRLALVADRIDGLYDLGPGDAGNLETVPCGDREALLIDPDRLLDI